VRRFALLAQRIIQLLLRERELDTQSHDKLAQIGYVVRSLCQGQEINHDFSCRFPGKNTACRRPQNTARSASG
jgi:hypothetical protein